MTKQKILHTKELIILIKSFVLFFCSLVSFLAIAQQGDVVAGGATTQRPLSISEPVAETYVANKKIKPKLGLITFYRPHHGAMPGVASLQVNGHYHSALQLGAYVELCLPVGPISVAARMTQVGAEIKGVYDATTTLALQENQNTYLRLVDFGDGRASLSLVQADVAKEELKNTRRQAHVRSRVPGATECVDSNTKIAQANEAIILVADGMFDFGLTEISVSDAKARQSIDDLIKHIKKTYGTEKNIRVSVVAHTDPIGNAEVNKRLSLARANAIRNYMIKGGLVAEQITSEGMGSEQPLYTTCGTEATPKNITCNKSNRRMVVTIQTSGL
jgi:outer membrane protein OmpA-like peptidoglycan-associated protein